MMMGTEDSFRIRRQTSNPSMPGRITSRTTRSGRHTRTSSRPASPLVAMRVSHPSFLKLYATERAMSASSSTTRTFCDMSITRV